MNVDLSTLPSVSSPLPWHGDTWRQLGEQLQQDKLPHALLISGEPATGKARLALALSRLLLCERPQQGMNCGECHACHLSATGVHGDFSWVQPEESSRAIKIDQVRRLIQFSTQTASFGARKVMVLSPANSMNVAAFNALLKLLEEPSPDSYLILVCDGLHNVPATIRSRCQIRQLAPPAVSDAGPWLEAITGSAEDSEQLLAAASGRPLLAQQMYEEGSLEVFLARRAGLHGLLAGKIDVPTLTALWGDVEVSEFLEHMIENLEQWVRHMNASQLSQIGRAVFSVIDELRALRAAVAAGSNPGRAMLIDAVLSKCHRLLGAAEHGDTIFAQSTGAA